MVFPRNMPDTENCKELRPALYGNIFDTCWSYSAETDGTDAWSSTWIRHLDTNKYQLEWHKWQGRDSSNKELGVYRLVHSEIRVIAVKVTEELGQYGA